MSIVVEAQTGKAEAALKEFQRDLSKVDREKASATLAAEVDKGGFSVHSKLVDKADLEKASATLGFDVDTGGLARLKATQAVLTKESSRLSDVFDRSQLSIGQWTGILAASLPVIVDAAGALGALTASLGAATAGLGALGVGGGGALTVGLAGIASVAVPAIASLGDLKTAQDAYTEAVDRYGKESTQAETALTKLTFEQKRAGPMATALAGNLRTLTRRWRELTAAGQTDFIGMLNDGVTRLNRKLPMLAESANRSMKALRGGFDQFLDRATGPEFNHFIRVMTGTFAKSIGPIARGFGNIGKVLQRIAVAVAPDIVRMARRFEDMTQGWVESTRNARKLGDTVHNLVGHTRAWWGLLVAAKDLIVAVLVPGMGEGRKAVKGMTDQLKEWTAWVNSHPKEIRNFFKEAMETTKELAKTLIGFLPILFEIAKATRPIARAVLKIVQFLNSIKIGNFSALTALFGVFIGTKLVRGIQSVTAAFVAMRTAALGAGAASAAAGATGSVGGLGKVAAGGGIAGGTAGGAFASKFASAARFGLLGAGVAGVAAAFTTQGGIIDTIRGKGSVGGEEMAEGLAGQFSESVQPKLNRAFKNLNFSALDAMSGAIHQLVDDFKAAGIEVPDELRKMAGATDRQVDRVKEAFGDWRSSVNKLKFMIFRSMGDIKDHTRDALRDINRIQGISNEKRVELTRKTYHAELKTIRKSLRLGLISHKEANREIQNITRQILKAYGVQDVQRVIVSDRVLAGGTQIQHPGHQRGGPIGGSGVGDKVPAMLEPGEFVVNKKAAVAARPMLQKLNREVPRFQKGGAVGGKTMAKEGLGVHLPRYKATALVGSGIAASLNVIAKAGELAIRTAIELAKGRSGRGKQRGGFVVSEETRQGFQTGGIVGRKGLKPGARDTVPAMLEVGELVIPKEMVDKTKKNAKLTAAALTGELGKGHKEASKDTDKFVKNHGKAWDRLRSTTSKTTERFRKGTVDDFQKTSKAGEQTTDKMRQRVSDGFSKMRGNAVETSGKMKQGVSEDFRELTGAVGDGLRKIGQMTNNALRALGVKKVNFSIGVKGKQRGGLIPGTGDGDKVPVMAEPGEGFINKKAVQALGGKAAIDKINKATPRFAKGGIVAAGRLAQTMGLTPSEHPAYGGVGGGHTGGSYHYKNQAIDVSGGDMRRYFGAVANRWMGHGLAELFYDPMGRYVKNDSWVPGAIGDHMDHVHVAITSAFGGAMVKKLKQVLLKGPDGPPKDIGQASLDTVRKAADTYVQKKMPTEGMEGAITGSGDVERMFARVAKKLSTSKTATLALGEAGFAESGMRDLAYGDSTSQGALQLLSSTAAGMNINPHDEGAIASAFLLRGFYGRGGANKLAAQGLPAHLVAQGVQGSAFASGSNYAAQAANAKSWMRRFGLREGGVVPGFQRGGVLRIPRFDKGGAVMQSGLREASKSPVDRKDRAAHAVAHRVGKAVASVSDVVLKRGDREGDKAVNKKATQVAKPVLEDRKVLGVVDRTGVQHLARGGMVAAPFVGSFDKGGEVAKTGLGMLHKGERVEPPEHGRGSPFRQYHVMIKRLAKHIERVQARLEEVREQKRPQWQRREMRLERRIEHTRGETGEQRQLVEELKELRKDIREHNHLYRTVRRSDKQALAAIVDLTSAQIGAQGQQKSRLAGWGVDRRY